MSVGCRSQAVIGCIGFASRFKKRKKRKTFVFRLICPAYIFFFKSEDSV